MNLLRLFKNHYGGAFGFRRFHKAMAAGVAAPAVTVPVELPSGQLTSPPLRIADGVLEFLQQRPSKQTQSPFTGIPQPPPGVRPSGQPLPKGMAMDEAPGLGQGGAIGAWATGGLWGEGLFFPGYPYLAELAQRPEYRHMVETLAEQMTRKWIKLNATGKTDKSAKIAKLEAAMKRFNLREAFYKAMELDGFFGMGTVYIDIDRVSDDPPELASPLLFDDDGRLKPEKLPKGKLRGFVPVDPTWMSPKFYNSTDPLKPDYFVPSAWYVMGKEVHVSRLLIFRSREVPDILKAAYNFGGLSLSQLAKPYVDNWLRTRQSVSDLLHSFTTFIFKTTMQAFVNNAEAFAKRVTAFILGRDNKGLMVVDKDQEELDNVSAPLGSLDKLQAQAQEQMASVSQQPLVWLLGITPTGLNTSASDEIRVFYDRVKAKQEKVFGSNITTAIQAIQLNEFGSIDEEIGFEFLALWELDDAGNAAVDKTNADADSVRITDGVISQEEARVKLAADPRSRYHGLEGPPPEPPEDPDAMDPDKSDTSEQIDKQASEGSETGANSGA